MRIPSLNSRLLLHDMKEKNLPKTVSLSKTPGCERITMINVFEFMIILPIYLPYIPLSVCLSLFEMCIVISLRAVVMKQRACSRQSVNSTHTQLQDIRDL